MKADSVLGCIFDGYISDFSADILSIGKNYTFFSKQQDIEILLPKKIEKELFYKNFQNIESELDKDLILQWYYISSDNNIMEDIVL